MTKQAKAGKSKAAKRTAKKGEQTKPMKKKSTREPSPYRAAITAALVGKASTFTFGSPRELKVHAYKAWAVRRLMQASALVLVSMADGSKLTIGPKSGPLTTTAKKVAKAPTNKSTTVHSTAKTRKAALSAVPSSKRAA